MVSEVAKLRQRIADECEASWQALYGLAAGVAQHEVIRQRFRNMDQCCQHLAKLVGEEQATAILWEEYNRKASEQG